MDGTIKKIGHHTQKEVAWKGRILGQNIVKGYCRVELCKEGQRKSYFVHRLVATAFIPNIGGYPHINHKNFDRADNHVDNLEWCTQRQNCMHAIKNGRKPDNRGEKHGMAKLPECDVLTIKKEFEINGYKHGDYSKMAKNYGVSSQCISDIHKGRRWSWI